MQNETNESEQTEDVNGEVGEETLMDEALNEGTKDKSESGSNEETKLTEEIEKLKQKNVRLLADFDNLKRRSAMDIIEAKSKGKTEVFEQILDVLDNFERSLQYDSQTKEFKEGINLVHNQLIDRLTALGLEEVEAEGQLDHNFHQAIVVDEDQDGYEDNEIIEVMQKGYQVNDKMIRPAFVKVNKNNK